MLVDESKNSRFAELALELFGAQAANDFLTKVWEQASPEVKQRLSDALIARVAKRVQEMSSWDIENYARAPLAELARAAMEERSGEIKEKILAQANARVRGALTPQRVDTIVKVAIDDALKDLTRKLFPEAK